MAASDTKEMAQGPVECISAMESAFGVPYMAIFCRVNAMKYLWRCGHTDGVESNLRKALYYLNKALSYELQLKAANGSAASGD